MISLLKWGITRWLMGAGTHKGAKGITIQKECESFFFHFFIWNFLNKIFCNLLLKIQIVAPIYHMFWVNHCWININFSKCVNFAKFCVSSWNFIIILNNIKYVYLFIYFSCIINYNFVLYVTHITPHLHVVKDSWNFNFLKNNLNF
jgi:hypothetical protein